jgi:acetylglutamate kinase
MGESDPVATCARKTVVVKYGGAAVERGRLLDGFLHDIAALRSAAIDLVVVHGGGPQISRLMEESGKTPRFVVGMRVTDDETMELVERALRQVNDEIAQMINRQGARAIGLGGGPGPLIHAIHRMHVLPTGESVDLGRVGDVAGVNTTPIRALLERGVVPVIGPTGVGADHRTYNINADLVAGEVAAVMGAALLIYLTDVPGIVDRSGGRVRRLSRWDADCLVRDGVIDGGMLPKIEGAVRALKGGAAQALIVDGRVPHALRLTLRAPHHVGTEIVL